VEPDDIDQDTKWDPVWNGLKLDVVILLPPEAVVQTDNKTTNLNQKSKKK
jgi:hypothetical protein